MFVLLLAIYLNTHNLKYKDLTKLFMIEIIYLNASKASLACLDNSYNDSEKTKSTTENLNDKDFNES